MVRAWHVAQGWQDIGYHWLICMNGLIQRGRPEEQIGAHVRSHNVDSIGIAMCGVKKFSEGQWTSLFQLLKAEKKKFPHAKLFGHYELDQNGKACPNFLIEPIRAFWAALNEKGDLTWTKV